MSTEVMEPVAEPLEVPALQASTDVPQRTVIARRRRRAPLAPLLAIASVPAGLACAVLIVLLAVLHADGAAPTAPISVYGTSPTALREIPPGYLGDYQATGQRYGIDWAILAGIGKVESDHGRSRAPGVASGLNTNGCCAGPMQFWVAPPHPNTWDHFGVDGNGDGRRDPYDPADAIPAAASYLRASGAPRDYRKALFAYNHASWYVEEVLHAAERYRGAITTTLTPMNAPGPVATLGADGYALAPLDAPPAISELLAAGNELQSTPYGPAGHPDPVGAPAQDCSSSTSYVFYRAGLMSRRALVSSGFLAWGRPGPGRWVTVWAKPGSGQNGHVYVVIAGLRLDTNYGYDTGPHRAQRGPRWRLGPAPTQAAGYQPRHPPSL